MSLIARCFLTTLGLLLCQAASAQSQRTFVASYGNDANVAVNCTLTSPCRSFSAAQNATAGGGEIVALDAAGYGAVTITKSISILANPGVYAGISISTAGSAVAISGAGLTVRLSGLKINNTGVALYGIVMSTASSLSVENCTITGFTHSGISVSGTGSSIRIVDSASSNNSIHGIQIANGAVGDIVNTRTFGNGATGITAQDNTGTLTRVSVTDSVASQNGDGFRASTDSAPGSTASMFVSGSTADHNTSTGFRVDSDGPTFATMAVASSKSTRNAVGFSQAGSGLSFFNSGGNNAVQENAADSAGTITNIGTI